MSSSRTLTISLIAVLVALISFVAITINNSDAQEQVSCPVGSVLADDGETCVVQNDEDGDGVNDNVTVTTSCTVGVLSEDGQSCIVPRLDAAPATAPAGDGGAAPVPIFTG